ncbi:hypothetical protein [Methylobacterium sp. J-070]|uniref:hypothetical protein n=1 Tax=Methylobacterium sp. J-070 TaxID=2836650 RepID=UPI001FB909B3|nr:hypothetical protein [Methylobacterium sp. J-070]MCJ2053494.1 hypothetical protein [Methylobacterium sp. J-070]
MLKDRRIPTWLARRTYFKRIGRWTKLNKNRSPATPPAESAAIPSNVVPFPTRESWPNRPALPGLRGVSMA